ncbi:MAG: hypothetical protein NTZ05_02065 [Chloroflexi bacterium]|nr:hypothetical protein [Chloroflexota bacterium]
MSGGRQVEVQVRTPLIQSTPIIDMGCGMTTKAELHQIIDELRESELAAAARFLEAVRAAAGDPVLLALLTAPVDDEPETPEERAAVAVAKSSIAAGEPLIPHEQVRREVLGPQRPI